MGSAGVLRRPRVRWTVGITVVAVAALVAIFVAAHRRSGSAVPAPEPRAGAWQPLGEPGVGGRITGLAIDPADPRRMLVGGDILGVGLSTDGGRHWQATTGFASWEMNAFTWSPRDRDVVWVGTMSGPYVSRDGGRTWRAMRDGLPTGDYPYSAPVQKVLVDARDPDRLLAVGGNERQLEPAGEGALHYGRVYGSDDAGRHWRVVSSLGEGRNIVDAVAAPDLSVIYAAVLHHGIDRSTDMGRTWTPVDGGLPGDRTAALAIDPEHPDVVWAAEGRSRVAVDGRYRAGGVYVTRDGGAHWSESDRGIATVSSADPDDASAFASILDAGDDVLYTADQGAAGGGAYVSRDGGASWSPTGSATRFYPARATPYAYAAGAHGRVVVAGTSDSLLETDDRGARWRDIGSHRSADGWRGNGFSGLIGTAVAFDAARPGVMLLGALDAGNVLRTGDGGGSWTRPLAGWDAYDGGYDVAIGGPHGDDAYAVLGQQGAFNGLASSHDAGETWRVRVGGELPARHADGGGGGSVALAGPSGRIAYAVLPDRHLFRTDDGGRTWTRVALADPARAVTWSPGLGAVVATSEGVVIAAGASAPRPMSGAPRDLSRLIADGADGLLAVGPLDATTSGLWRYARGRWSRIATGSWIGDAAVDPRDHRRVVYTTNDEPYHDVSHATGVWVSCDAGRTFARDDRGLPMLRVQSVAFDPSAAGRLVIGLNGRGFWQQRIPACR